MYYVRLSCFTKYGVFSLLCYPIFVFKKSTSYLSTYRKDCIFVINFYKKENQITQMSLLSFI